METSTNIALNLDAMLEIMSFLPTPSLTPILCTCRILYNAAIPFLLRHIDLPYDLSKIKAFCDFCNVDLLTRCPLIKTFSINLGLNINSHGLTFGSLVKDISTILLHALNLESLTVEGMPEYWFRKYSSLADAIASLTNLKIFRCGNGGYSVAETVARINSPLSAVMLYTGLIADMPVLPIICTFHRTLTEISISDLVVEDIDCEFSFTSKLTVWDDWKDIEVDQLVRIFPNINNLTLCTPVGVRARSADETVVAHMRPQNITAQTHDGIGYSSLWYLCGDPTSLFILALICPVRHLHFKKMASSFIPRGRTVIEAAHPIHLTVEVLCCEANDLDVHTLLREVTAAGHLTHLTILFHVHCDWDHNNYRLEVAVDHLITGILSWGNLKYIRLLYNWTPRFYISREQLDGWPMTKYLKQLNFSVVGRSLARRVPSLRYIFLEIMTVPVLGIRREPAYFETVSLADSKSSTVEFREISAGEGQRIIKAEGAVERLAL